MRLIDADALMEVIRAHDYPLKAHYNSTDNGMFTLGIQQAVDECPTIESPQGEWIEKKFFLEDDPEYDRIMWVCSVCEKQGGCTDFCPHCGAKMKGVEA